MPRFIVRSNKEPDEKPWAQNKINLATKKITRANCGVCETKREAIRYSHKDWQAFTNKKEATGKKDTRDEMTRSQLLGSMDAYSSKKQEH